MSLMKGFGSSTRLPKVGAVHPTGKAVTGVGASTPRSHVHKISARQGYRKSGGRRGSVKYNMPK